jgi:glycosyltransferase involved in cell wall biosynthesis
VKVSVIIPTFNRKHIVQTAINSVLRQSYKDFEIIVIDDGSTDGSYEFLKAQYASQKKVTILKQAHSGVSSARNLGIKNASGDWIAFLDSDDFFHKDKLEKQTNLIKQNPQYKICHSEEIWIRDGQRLHPHKKHQKTGGDIFQKSVELCSISISTVLVQITLFQELGSFDESMPACEDYDLWLRLTSKYKVLLHPEYLITKFGGHQDQLSKIHWGMDRFRIYALEKLLNSKILTPDQEIITKQTLRKKITIFLKGAKKHKNTEYINAYEKMLEKLS